MLRYLIPLLAALILHADASVYLKEAIQYEAEGDYRSALKLFYKAAQMEESEAMYRIGRIYDNGFGIERDFREAALWYRKAAQHHHNDAMFTLGAMYSIGDGITKDPRRGRYWIEKAKLSGSKAATLYLSQR